jgi:hypothetical protein
LKKNAEFQISFESKDLLNNIKANKKPCQQPEWVNFWLSRKISSKQYDSFFLSLKDENGRISTLKRRKVFSGKIKITAERKISSINKSKRFLEKLFQILVWIIIKIFIKTWCNYLLLLSSTFHCKLANQKTILIIFNNFNFV